MGSVQNTVYYCCVSKGNRILYAYSCGDDEIENLATVCLEKAPLFHAWYFETVNKRTYGFLMEDGYVYFTIVDEGLGNPGVLQFLEHVRDEFKKVARKGSRGSISSLNSNCIEEQLVPVIRRLITSLEHVPRGVSDTPSPNENGQIEVVSSTMAPLLGKVNKHDRKKMKDHVIAMRENDLEQQRKSMDLDGLDSSTNDMAVSSISSHKELGSRRLRSSGSQNARSSSSQSIRKKWCRHVRIVLAVDAVVCLILLAIWLAICNGIECLR